jgi:hypothetical protein
MKRCKTHLVRAWFLFFVVFAFIGCGSGLLSRSRKIRSYSGFNIGQIRLTFLRK